MNNTSKQTLTVQSKSLESKQLLAAKLLSLVAVHKLPPKLLRYTFAMVDRMFGLNKIKMYQVVDVSIPVSTASSNASSKASSIKIRSYYPDENIPKKTLVYFHGGGCVIGGINTHDRFCRYLAKHGKMNIISVDYRLSPEFKFPTPICDAIDAWNYINDNHQKLKIDPTNIGVGGDSAGGYLACLVGLKSLQTNLPVQAEVTPAFQFLIYPMLDLQGLSESYRTFNKQLLLTRDLMDYFRDHYLQSFEQTDLPLVSPLKASELGLSPETYILTLGYDPLRDDGIAYAQRLAEAGVSTQHQHFEDCMHGFISITRISPRAKQAVHEVALALNRFN